MSNFLSWGFQLDRPLVIAGPCSIESESQAIETALALKDFDVDILRGGIWKARTRPKAFEGLGEKALPWLIASGKAINKPVATEVASSKHVETVLKHAVHYVWIGARTAANPFAVQDIADALRGSNVPVFVKNPVTPDLNLWIGAVERIKHAGIEHVAVIHRGFKQYGESEYRNRPIWPIVIEFRQEMPEIPILCDPSHITGNRKLIFPVAQMALDLGLDGLMIETHCNPEEAWSDAKQQITPINFNQLTIDLKQRQQGVDNEMIFELRHSLDEIDKIVLDIIGERMKIVREMGTIKREKNIAIYQPEQLREMLLKRLKEAAITRVSEEFVHNLFEAIHTESIRQQSTIFYRQQTNVEQIKQ